MSQWLVVLVYRSLVQAGQKYITDASVSGDHAKSLLNMSKRSLAVLNTCLHDGQIA